MPRIERTDVVGGDLLDVQFDNGHTILLDCSVLLKRPGFAPLEQDGLLCCPLTDGERLFWQGGQSMTVEDILAFVSEENQNKGGTANEN